MPDFDPDPSTLEELLAWVRAREQELDPNLENIYGFDLSGPACDLARRDGMATVFHEVEHLLEVLLDRFGRTDHDASPESRQKENE